MQLDDHLKNLLRELGHAINDTVSESDRITGAIAGVRAHGYDIVLKLDATIGLAKRDGSNEDEPRMSTQDRRFLESLRIQVDQESMEQDATDKKALPRLSYDAAGCTVFEIIEDCNGRSGMKNDDTKSQG